MDNNKTRSTRRHAGWPTLDQFHEILTKLAPNEESTKFTPAAVVGLRSMFLTYMEMVGSSLEEHDSLKEEEKVVNALAINPQFAAFAEQAKDLIRTQPKDTAPKKKRAKRKRKMEISAEMEAEQNRLLEQAREAVINKRQKTEE